MKRRNIIFKQTIIFLLVVAWFAVLAKAFSRISLNSDMASMVIEANEILSGNFSLSGRYLTGLTFLPTDLLFFIIGGLFFGISGKTYIMAQVLMYSASALATLLLIYDIYHKENIQKKGILFVSVFLLFTGFPGVYMCQHSTVHQGCFAWCLFAMYFLNKIVLKKQKKHQYYIAAAIFMTMACMGDSLAYVAVIIPIIIFSLIKIFWWLYQGRKEKLNSFYWITIAVAAGAAILGKLLTAIYILIGNADLNAYIGTHKFIDLNQFYEKFILLINGIAQLFDACFTGGTVSSVDTLLAFVKFFLIIGFIGISISLLFKYCIGGGVENYALLPKSYASAVLGLGFVLIAVLMVFTDFSVNTGTTRYFCYLPFVTTIWLSEWLDSCTFSTNKMGKLLLTVICLVFMIQSARRLIFDTRGKWFSFEPSPVGKEEIVDKIQELGLRNGYSEYWDANYSTVQSEGKIMVNSVTSDGTHASVHCWFSDPEDYREYTNFVIAGDLFSAETVQNIFGTPQLVEEAAGSKIMVYDYDLSKAIRFADEDGNWSSEMEKENIYTCLSFTDTCHNEIAYNENGTRYLPYGGASFGPYISLEPGSYEVEIIGSGLDKAVYSAYTWKADNYTVDVVETGESKGVYKVDINRPTEKFEFCIENASNELVEIRQMFIREFKQ